MYLPANFLTHNHRTDPQRPTYSTFRPFRHFSEIPRRTVRFWDSTNYHTQSPTITICSEVFFWVCFGFLRFSFAITVLSCFVPHSRSTTSLYDFVYLTLFFFLLRFRLFPSDFYFYDFVHFGLISSFIFSFVSVNMISYSYCIRLRISYLSTYISSCSQVFLGSGMGNERLANVA